jgi:hypothetical protein
MPHDDDDAWLARVRGTPQSIDALLRLIDEADQWFANLLEDETDPDPPGSDGFNDGVEIERSLLSRLRRAVHSQDPVRLQRVLRLIVHRSHFKPIGAHSLVKPVHGYCTDQGLDLGARPNASLAYRCNIALGCILMAMLVLGGGALLIAIYVQSFLFTAMLGIITASGWLGMKIHQKRTPQDAPRRYRERQP